MSVSLIVCGLVSLAAQGLAKEAAAPAVESKEQFNQRMAWWREARFGMFIHWGIYAVPADGEWYMTQHHVPVAQYEKYAAKFNPVQFDADQWARVAHDAGMKYLVITAKHHDGFCMFKTSTTKYNVVDATPWRQDPLAALSKACKAHGIRFCCYYSIMDWHTPLQTAARPGDKNPEYNPTKFANAQQKADYKTYMKAQLKDLITQYHPGAIWFDGGWINWSAADGKDLVGYLRQLDPQLIVNDRANSDGDYGTPEQEIPANGRDRDWETCMTINGSWGFSANDHGFKSTAELLHNLMDIASKGGNYLLNVGPTDQGVIPAEEVQRLKQMGAWLNTNGAALYDTTASPFKKQKASG
jgi:alpha-L-fucosidase